MTNHLINITAVAAIAVLMSFVGPKLDEIQATTQDALAAQKDAQRRARFEQAAQAICGENAGWVELGGGEIQCKTKRGHKTLRASL